MVVKRNTIKRLNIEIQINEDYCKGCNICAEFACERKQYEMYETDEHAIKAKTRDHKFMECVGCGYCELLCPNQAIRVKNGWHDKHIIIPQEE